MFLELGCVARGLVARREGARGPAFSMIPLSRARGGIGPFGTGPIGVCFKMGLFSELVPRGLRI